MFRFASKKAKKNRIKAAYYCDDGECSVLVNSSLPREPKLFAMAHELKHHYLDQEQILNGQIYCGDYNANELIEKGGEVFAAEFIYPEQEMRELLGQMKISSDNCTAETVVLLKPACPAWWLEIRAREMWQIQSRTGREFWCNRVFLPAIQ